jgi:hypothetical protein
MGGRFEIELERARLHRLLNGRTFEISIVISAFSEDALVAGSHALTNAHLLPNLVLFCSLFSRAVSSADSNAALSPLR